MCIHILHIFSVLFYTAYLLVNREVIHWNNSYIHKDVCLLMETKKKSKACFKQSISLLRFSLSIAKVYLCCSFQVETEDLRADQTEFCKCEPPSQITFTRTVLHRAVHRKLNLIIPAAMRGDWSLAIRRRDFETHGWFLVLWADSPERQQRVAWTIRLSATPQVQADHRDASFMNATGKHSASSDVQLFVLES